MAVQRVEAARAVTAGSMAEPVTVEARACKVDGRWNVEVDLGGRLLTVRVSSLDDVDVAVNRLLSRRPRLLHPCVRVHIYWYHYPLLDGLGRTSWSPAGR